MRQCRSQTMTSGVGSTGSKLPQILCGHSEESASIIGAACQLLDEGPLPGPLFRAAAFQANGVLARECRSGSRTCFLVCKSLN